MADLEKIILYNEGGLFRCEKPGLKIVNEILYQFKICLTLAKIHRKCDIIWIYGGATLIFPIIAARLFRVPLYVNLLGLESMRIRIVYSSMPGALLAKVVCIVERLSWSLADHIVIESKGMIEFANLQKYEHKILAMGARFIDLETFNISHRYDERENIVGFIGRLSREKGVDKLLHAIRLLKKDFDTIGPVKFLFCGDGPLLQELKDISQMEGGLDVEFVGWIGHDEIPQVLNKLKLLVLPSSTEGLPTIVLEAMACGTPILATAVGGIPDVIQDGETGFLMSDNSPKMIAQGIYKSLSYNDPDKIIKKAKGIIYSDYTFNVAVQRYRKILSEV